MTQKTFSALAATDLTACQFHLARWSAAGYVNISSYAATDQGAGVIQTVSRSGEAVTVAYGGKSFVTVGAAIAADTLFTCNGSGRAIAAGSGEVIYGRVLETAAADGNWVRCLLFAPFIN